RSAFRLQQLADFFLSAFPLPLCVLFFFAFLFRRFLSRRSPALPGDHSLRPSASSLYGLPNFNEPESLQPLQRGSINTKFCRWTKRQCAFLFFELREKRRLLRREPVRQFTAAQAARRFAPRIR